MGANELERTIGRWGLVALVVNTVVGSAILGLPGKVHALVGGYSILGWLPCALIMGLVAACFAEIGSRFRDTGGPYLYALEAFGPCTGFVVGWLSWVSRLFSLATIANLMITYSTGFVPGLGSGLGRAAGLSLLFAILAMLLLTGARASTRINTALSVAKIMLIGGFIVAGLVVVPDLPDLMPADWPAASSADWRTALMLMTFAFIGIESAMINTGEMRNPRRDLPFALGLGLVIIAALYIGVQVVCMAALSDLADSQRPMAEAAAHLFGRTGELIIGGGALVMMFGTLLAVLLTASRLPFALAENDQLPKVLTAVHPGFHTPWMAILLTAVLGWLLSLSSSFLIALTISTLTRLIGYVTSCAALIVLRRREASPGFTLPGGSVLSLLASALTLWLMLGSSKAELLQVALLVVIGAVCGGAYAILRRLRGVPPIVEPHL